MRVLFRIEKTIFETRSLELAAELGRPTRFTVDVLSPDAIDGAELLGKPVRVEVHADDGTTIAHHGIVESITAHATLRPTEPRRYTVVARSAIEWLSHRTSYRIFRKMTAVEIVEEVLKGGGIEGPAFVIEITTEPPKREHVTQYAETDAAFLRRICEEEGLYFRFDPQEDFDAFVLCDRSQDAPDALEAPLPFVDEAGLRASDVVAFKPNFRRDRRVGKVTLRDFDPAKPALRLEGVAEAGLPAETSVEVYRAPGRFSTPEEGERVARLALEALRARAEVLSFETRAFALRPGAAFEADVDRTVGYVPSGKYVVIETSLSWRADGPEGGLRVVAIPIATGYRLERRTPRPQIPGITTGTVAGRDGEEIHTDAAAAVKVSFPWDRQGPKDENASLPIRVMQNNLPGSMLIPRVGWEALVGFEDGDPDRPYVLGRSFNGRMLPPFGLPANKTMTALGTVSSPGAGRSNMISIDDAAGRQHMVWNAGFGKTTIVGADMSNQTVGFDKTHIIGSQSWSVGGDETISIEDAWTVGVGSQSGTVSGNQTVTIKATGATSVGSETVIVGGALIEKVGNPVTGLAEFAKSAVIAAAGEIPVVGTALSKGLSWGKALYSGYQSGGWSGVAQAAGQTALGEIAGKIPGGDAIIAAADGAGLTPWSDKAKARAAQQQGGGGAAGAAAAGGGAAAAAPGHRKLVVDGTMTEAIGAIHGIQTPGSCKWTTLGVSTFAVGGSHTTTAVRISRLTMARSSDKSSVMKLNARKNIARNVKTAQTLKAGGLVALSAGGTVGVKAKGSMTITAGGPAKLEGSTVVFEVGGSTMSIHGGGVTLESSKITVNGKTHLSGKETVG